MSNHAIKQRVNNRIHEEGRWEAFEARRKEIVAAGTHPIDAWRQAVRQFPPLDGTPCELDLPPPEPAPETVAPPPPAKRPADAKQKDRFGPEWAALAAKVPATKIGSEREAARWVFEHYMTDVSEIDPATAPSRGAIGLLWWVRTHPVGYHEFLTSIWVKTMPTQAQMRGEGRFNDDGRKTLALFDIIDAEHAKESEHGSEHQRDSGLPAGA